MTDVLGGMRVPVTVLIFTAHLAPDSDEDELLVSNSAMVLIIYGDNDALLSA